MEVLSVARWFYACRIEDVPANGGVCVKLRDEQIALFNFARRGQWYATQNLSAQTADGIIQGNDRECGAGV
jgi:nitrite reductase/ring-hydroxylating ferredoxin subunit